MFNRWRNKKVYYQFADDFGQTDGAKVVKKVVDFYEKNTCIRFEENSTVPFKITIKDGGSCLSSIGFTGNASTQFMTLGYGCWNFGNVAHEFLHSLGFHHTHARTDRDNFIKIHKENVLGLFWRSNFPIPDANTLNTYTPYEYASVMHYPAEAFAMYKRISIVAKDHRYAYTMGSRRKLTFYDLKALNEHYQCTGQCHSKVSAKCSNGGYPNPNNCSTCICPEGYSGQFCNKKPSGCGSSFVATAEWHDATLIVDSNSTTEFIDNLQCHDWITAPEGKFVEVKITSLFGASCEYGCNNGAMEIKLDTPEESSPRLCCPTFIGTSYVSKLNPTPVIAFSYKNQLAFEYQYRFVDEAPQIIAIDPKEPACTDKWTRCPVDFLSCWDGIEGCPVTCNTCPK